MQIHKLESNAGGKLTARRAASAKARQPRPTPSERDHARRDRRQSRLLSRSPRAHRPRRDAQARSPKRASTPSHSSPDDSVHGAVESRDEAKACAALFRTNADKIAGVDRHAAQLRRRTRHRRDAAAGAASNVPVLIHATADDPAKMGIDCSARRVLRQDVRLQRAHAVRHSILAHVAAHPAAGVRQLPRRPPQLRRASAAWCAVSSTARIGAIGARPAAFKTVRYSEKILEASGIAVEPIDLSEILGRIDRLRERRRRTSAASSTRCTTYVTTDGIPSDALIKMAKLGLVIDRWMKRGRRNVSAVQCWTSMEEFFGVVPCTIMSMMSDVNMPSACEVDVCGTISMYALTLASETPSALLDWNNNYGDDPEQGGLLPLQQPAEGVLRRRADGLPGDHRRHRRAREHLRHDRRQGAGRAR